MDYEEERLYRSLAKTFDMPFVKLMKEVPSAEAIRIVPADIAREIGIVPLRLDEGRLILACWCPLDFFTLEFLRYRLGVTTCECALATRRDVEAALEKFYPDA